MKTIICTLFFSFSFCTASFAQDETYLIVEEMPSFPGGKQALIKYIQENLTYPQSEKENDIQGTCYVTFVVTKGGNITDVKILGGIEGCENCDKECVRVVKSMPQWNPGKQNGQTVAVQLNVPIKFGARK